MTAGTGHFYRKKFSIKTSSKGWQEIAIESGYLNNNDPSLTFKPTQIRCYDRKIDMRSGIHVSFDDRHAEIAEFHYVTGADLYERQDLFYDASLGNVEIYQRQRAIKINTIK